MQANHRQIANLLHLALGGRTPEQFRNQFHIQAQASRFAQYLLHQEAIMRRGQDDLVHKSSTGQPGQITV